MLTLTRRLTPFLLAGLLLVPQAAPAAAGTTAVSATDLTSAGTDLVTVRRTRSGPPVAWSRSVWTGTSCRSPRIGRR